MSEDYSIIRHDSFVELQHENGKKLTMALENFKFIDGYAFKNLSGHEQLLPYEDWRLSAPERGAKLGGTPTMPTASTPYIPADALRNIRSPSRRELSSWTAPPARPLQLHNPCVVSEFEPVTDGILAHFGVENKVIMEILSGEAVPGGRLPLIMPADMETVEKHCEDIFDDLESYVDACGNRYDYGFGLKYGE